LTVPTSAQLASPAKGFFAGAGLRGEDAPGIATALADAAGQTLTLLLSQAQVMPGIPATIDPISGSGATAGPGLLMPPPAGGPGASQLEGPVLSFLNAQGIRGSDADGLGKAIADILAQAVQLFTAQAQVAPGIAIAGFVSNSPGTLQPVPLHSQLKQIASGLVQQNGLRGEDASSMADAIAQAVDVAFTLFATQALVSPGIPAAPGATAGPGRLL